MTSMISAVILVVSLLFQSPAMALAAPFFQSSGECDEVTSRMETISVQAGDALQDTIGSITGDGGQKGKQSEVKAKAAGKTVDRNTKELVAKDNRMVNKAVN
ncbi:hypothetical protein KBY97_03185 [Synechococcus sp. ATX 2A4]|nr:hypothetical protein [Synechococcus sp. ATX 2A4]